MEDLNLVRLGKHVVYHRGEGHEAFYTRVKWGPGQRMRSSDVVLLDGTTPPPTSPVVCGTCKKTLQVIDLTYDPAEAEPPQLYVPRKHKSGEKPEGYYRAGSPPKKRREKLADD